MQLNGKSALITGGARRLGRAMAVALAERGVRLALHYGQSRAEAEALAAELRAKNVEIELFQADLADGEQIRRMVADADARFGGLDILVNNAAIFERKPFPELTEDDWRRTLDVNLTAPFLCAHAAGTRMHARGAGAIVNMACVGGFLPWANYLPYSVSKAGVIMLTETLAKALAPAVRVNAIAPGIVNFEERDEGGGMRDESGRTKDETSSSHPSSLRPHPSNIVAALLYLLENDAVTGETLVVDAGRRVGVGVPPAARPAL
jgi:pteridine reductase